MKQGHRGPKHRAWKKWDYWLATAIRSELMKARLAKGMSPKDAAKAYRETFGLTMLPNTVRAWESSTTLCEVRSLRKWCHLYGLPMSLLLFRAESQLVKWHLVLAHLKFMSTQEGHVGKFAKEVMSGSYMFRGLPLNSQEWVEWLKPKFGPNIVGAAEDIAYMLKEAGL